MYILFSTLTVNTSSYSFISNDARNNNSDNNTHMHAYVHTYICTYVHTYMQCACTYIYIYINIHTYIHMHTALTGHREAGSIVGCSRVPFWSWRAVTRPHGGGSSVVLERLQAGFPEGQGLMSRGLRIGL